METRPKLTCPWWFLFTFDNPIRNVFMDPMKMLAPYVHAGDTVLDVGCGMGFCSIPLSNLVGESGRVLAADLQPQMLAGLRRRAEKVGVSNRIRTIQSNQTSIGIDDTIDFALAFWMFHEVGHPIAFMREIDTRLKSGGSILVVEPLIHVSAAQFLEEVEVCKSVGWLEVDRPEIRFSRSIRLTKPA
jgi:ubiquinone/menaquinone biosynthesis C-methylase UbiE